MSARPSRPPVVVVDDPTLLDATRIGPGWAHRTGFTLPARPLDLSGRRWACVGTIDDRATARAAVDALERGVALVVAITLDRPERLALREDLERLGDLTAPADRHLLDDDQRDLLARLADGATVAEAARAVGMSLRTANRRLADARARLGVTTTVEAVVHRDRPVDPGTVTEGV